MQAYADYEDVMDLTEELVSGLVQEIKGSYKVTISSHCIENEDLGHHKIIHSHKAYITIYAPWCQGY